VAESMEFMVLQEEQSVCEAGLAMGAWGLGGLAWALPIFAKTWEYEFWSMPM